MGNKTLFYDVFESKVGPLLLMSDGENIIRIDYGTMYDLDERLIHWSTRYFTNPVFVHDPEKVAHAKQQLQEYFSGDRMDFSFAIYFHGTSFQKQVWQALCDAIPYGGTRTYKDIAEEIGNPKAVRAIGGAVNKNPFSIVVPCHRVIGANGSMVGYNGGLDKKEYLLVHEQYYKEARQIV